MVAASAASSENTSAAAADDLAEDSEALDAFFAELAALKELEEFVAASAANTLFSSAVAAALLASALELAAFSAKFSAAPKEDLAED